MVQSTALAFSVALLVLLFLTAGVNKLRALEVFEGVVSNFRLLPESVVRPVAYGLPVLELAVAATLVVPALRSYGGLVAAILLGAFTVAIIINLLRGRREIDCGCFSSDLKQSLNWWLVLRNLVLLGLALWLTGANSIAQSVGLTEWLIGIAAAMMVAILYSASVLLSAAAQHAATRHAASQTAAKG